MANLHMLQDPTKQYPLPKFKHQPQRVPGIARKMQPKPDHGEESYRGSGRLPNRKALVTGGDSGIGRAAAIAFAREGADVVISYLPSEEADAKEVLDLIKAAGRKAYGIPGDVKNESFCSKLIQQAHKKLGGLDILAIVAGKQHAVEKIKDITTKQLEETYKVNVFALFWLCKAALSLMPKGASIITTASIQATHPSPSLLDYAPPRQPFSRLLALSPGRLRRKASALTAWRPVPFGRRYRQVGGSPTRRSPSSVLRRR